MALKRREFLGLLFAVPVAIRVGLGLKTASAGIEVVDWVAQWNDLQGDVVELWSGPMPPSWLVSPQEGIFQIENTGKLLARLALDCPDFPLGYEGDVIESGHVGHMEMRDRHGELIGIIEPCDVQFGNTTCGDKIKIKNVEIKITD